MSKKALDLMKGMLVMEPEDRYTALDCLADSYFDNIRDNETEKRIQG
jgi:serine/threonine protein kinase